MPYERLPEGAARLENLVQIESPAPCAPDLPAIPTLPTLEEALKTLTGRKLPKIMRAVAMEATTGCACKEISEKVGQPPELTRDYLERVAVALRCQLPESLRLEECRTDFGEVLLRRGVLAREEELHERTCRGCGNRITPDGWRLVLYGVVMDCDERPASGTQRIGHVEFEYDDDDRARCRYLPEAFCFCANCATNSAELAIPSAIYAVRQTEKIKRREQEEAAWQELLRSGLAAELDEEHAEEVREKTATAQAEEQKVAEELATGEKKQFNRFMPTMPRTDDVMYRVVPASKIDRGDLVGPTFEDLAGRGGNWNVIDKTSGERAQRATILEYLKSPRSRGVLTEPQRKAFRMWVGGASQRDAERATGINQANFSRLKRTILGKAHSGR